MRENLWTQTPPIFTDWISRNIQSGIIDDGGNAYSVTKTGAGTLMVSGANNYHGATIISNGVLALGAPNAIASNSAIHLTGGTLNLNGYNPTAFSNGLTVAGTGSTIDFGLGHSTPVTLQFSNSSALAWTSDLSLLDFTVGSDELGFGSGTGLTASQLSDIELSGYTASGLDSGGFVQFTAVPEPKIAVVIQLAFAMTLLFMRKRWSHFGRFIRRNKR
jgi:autotransporter-associated beta strand protein